MCDRLVKLHFHCSRSAPLVHPYILIVDPCHTIDSDAEQNVYQYHTKAYNNKQIPKSYKLNIKVTFSICSHAHIWCSVRNGDPLASHPLN